MRVCVCVGFPGRAPKTKPRICNVVICLLFKPLFGNNITRQAPACVRESPKNLCLLEQCVFRGGRGGGFLRFRVPRQDINHCDRNFHIVYFLAHIFACATRARTHSHSHLAPCHTHINTPHALAQHTHTHMCARCVTHCCRRLYVITE